ncbi:MAG: indolepyruvate ferredoxin oxidoreductase subunit beta [Candidatus Nezhaarchaeota archaeon]|nr:indolepyruvate ferredoxin oxidoreductase subunit beta [Candidatus Nezhaarchaeota archaeon]MCX8141186.1 indolepyruvate ferredoxin oxidoreductase subunit beta [Candidatus Nezhaarchaeota archaeon]MDW8049452.1 indolepyruvate ferredoxin oxidoreductase subunit beta [Nitrososphaerota archaeon]
MQTSKRDEITVAIAGVGGQGTLVASQIIGHAAVKRGFSVRISETFGMSQRGGPVVSHIRIAKNVYSPLIPLMTADVVVGFEPLEALRAALKFLVRGGSVIVNTRVIYPVEVNRGDAKYPKLDKILEALRSLTSDVVTLDATSLAIKAGNPIATNIVMLGALAALDKLPLEPEDLREAVKERVPREVEVNLMAFDLGFKAIREKRQ